MATGWELAQTGPAGDGAARIPRLGLGTWQLEGPGCAEMVRAALEMGVRHVDTAQGYGNEARVGEGIRRARVARESLFVTTKLAGDEALRREGVAPAVEASLRRLGLDVLDLVLIHWPSRRVPLEETLEALAALRERGRLRHIGVSNFPRRLVERACRTAPIACDQVEYHPYLDQRRLRDALRALGVALVAYSPLARGRVLGDPVLEEIAAVHGTSPAAVALRWLIQQPGVAAIPKASRPSRLREALGALSLRLDDAEMARIHALARGERLIDPDFAPRWDPA